MKITYKEFLKAIQKADAVTVDGNLTFPDVQEDGRINFYWDDSDGLDYRYYTEPCELNDEDPLKIKVQADGSFALTGLYSDDTDEFSYGTTTVSMLMITPYKKEKKK